MSKAVCRTPCNLTERRRGALLPDDSVEVQLTARLTNDLSTKSDAMECIGTKRI